jgi:superfamily II DNA or RNA helicase
MALSVIAHRKQPALIVVHTKELLEQWVQRIESFLGIPANQVGRIGGGRRIIGNKITVALVQTLYKCAEEAALYIGHLIVDECHRTPSRTFTEAVSAFDCKYMLGLSATPWRRDKLSRLIYWYLGDLVHEIEKEELIDTGDVLPAQVVIRETDFRPWSDPSTEYVRMLSELTEDPERNMLIAQDVTEEARNGGEGVCLVLSDRKAHCEAIQGLLAEMAVKSELLTGDLSNAERKRVVEDLNAGKVKVLVATGQLIGEGFDCKELSTLFLATPIKFDGRLLQYLGRVLRPAPGKDRARVFDYVDKKVGVLVAAAKTRRRVYTRRENG